ncbi:MAG TPA: hypothetical protein VE980_11020 [Pyrinomonadaceae bacterium]|nr:hypothetical protein [Pyrinomonadaceae bacterium]
MRCLLTLIAFGVLVPAGVKAQSSVTMKATVSEAVTLSAPNNMNVVSRGGNAVEITLAGDDQIVRVPLLVRSNTSFKISAIFESRTAVLSEISVEDVRATGSLVSPQVVNAVRVNPHLDPELSQPLLVLTGPRVSLGGTLNSPNNALEITVLIRWTQGLPREPIHLTLAATPVSLIQ